MVHCGRTIPREGLSDLERDPLRRRMVGHAQQDQTASFMPQDHQNKQQPKVDCRDYKEVHGPDSQTHGYASMSGPIRMVSRGATSVRRNKGLCSGTLQGSPMADD